MREIVIRVPIWNTGPETRSVGIDVKKVTDDLKITITYKDANEQLLYPEPLYISKKRALTYPTYHENWYPGSRSHRIPIKDLSATEETS